MRKKAQVVIIDINRRPFRLLLLKTNQKRGGFWQNVTGSLKKKETFHQGALRELEEETGIQHKNLIDLDLSLEFKDRLDRDCKEQVFLCLLKETPKEIIITEKEHQDYKWVKLKDIKKEELKFESSFLAIETAIKHTDRYKNNVDK